MKNWEKYEEEIKKFGFGFAVLKGSNEVTICVITSLFSCRDCIFYEGNNSCTTKRIHWLYSEYR